MYHNNKYFYKFTVRFVLYRNIELYKFVEFVPSDIY